MATRTGKLIMATKIKLDRGYKNVLSYSETEMVSLLTTNAIGSFTNCSFVRPDENVITIEMTYGNAIKCNYLGFQNPDYSNKWFFAFIDEIEYVSDKAVNVHFTIDEYATWYDYWSPEPCYVEREHANTDVAGDNLVPEQLELGDYTGNGDRQAVGFGTQGIYYCLLSIYTPKDQTKLATNLCGIGISGGLYFTDYWQVLANMVQQYATLQKNDSITLVYAIPAGLAGLMSQDSTGESWTTPATDETFYWNFTGKSSPYYIDNTLASPTKLNGYTPVNQKLLTAPYCCCILSNNNGTSNVLAYEYFTNRTIQVRTEGVPSVGCSIITYPQNYKGQDKNFLEAVPWGKYPTLSWSGDAYTNWLTQNSVNIGLGIAGDLISGTVGAAMVATGNPLGFGAIAGAGAGLFQQNREIAQHKAVPYVSTGNVNVSDVITSTKVNHCVLIPVSIRADMAERIDKYFTRFGYRVNKNKLPNQFGRQYWNYVKIGAGEDIGITSPTGSFSQIASVPPDSMETINNIYRNGVTIWHDHTNMGNFALSNPIV